MTVAEFHLPRGVVFNFPDFPGTGAGSETRKNIEYRLFLIG